LSLHSFFGAKKRKVPSLSLSFSTSFMRHQFGSIAARGSKRPMTAAFVSEVIASIPILKRNSAQKKRNPAACGHYFQQHICAANDTLFSRMAQKGANTNALTIFFQQLIKASRTGSTDKNPTTAWKESYVCS
jgi:hypothetical protein